MITCPNCGTKNEATAKFCIRCGRSLVAPPPPKPTRRGPGISLAGGLLIGLLVMALSGGVAYYLLRPTLGPAAPREVAPATPAATAVVPGLRIPPHAGIFIERDGTFVELDRASMSFADSSIDPLPTFQISEQKPFLIVYTPGESPSDLHLFRIERRPVEEIPINITPRGSDIVHVVPQQELVAGSFVIMHGEGSIFQNTPCWGFLVGTPSVDIGEAAPPALGTEDNPIALVFVPSGQAPEIIASAETLTDLLEEKTGYVFEGLVATSYSAAIEAMCISKAHIGPLATLAYLLAHEKCGVDVALVSVRFGSPFYKGQIIAGADTGITKIEDLAGKTVCWVDAASTSGYIIPRVMLQAAGVNPDTDLAQQIEAGSHPNVVLAVYSGDCDAGACYVDARDTIADDYPDVCDEVVVIAESDEIPNDGLQFIKDFPPDMREKIVQAFLELMATEEGVAAIGKAYGWQEVVVKDDSYYDPFRDTLEAAGVSVEDLAK